jgi:gluconolactonase
MLGRFVVVLFGCSMLPAAVADGILAGPVERVRTGFEFLEGPAGDEAGNVYFTDVPAQKVYLLTATGELGVFQPTSRHSNGLFIRRGFLWACEMDGQIVRYRLGDVNSREVLADAYMGTRFNACNDLVVDKMGGVYFTDPEYGAPVPWPQKVRSVYYLAPDKTVRRVVENLPNPNGVMLSPDESTLYVVPSSQSQVMAYPVTSPGMLGAGREFFRLEQPRGKRDSGGDGLTMDTTGTLYITTDLGVQVVDAQGRLVEIIRLPEVPANAVFGGLDRKTLYVTARTSLYRAVTHRAGHVFHD